jgi:hypothetical protein
VLRFLASAAAPLPGGRVKRWIADLNSDQFDVRRRAVEELQRLGEFAGPSLRAALANKPSLEVLRTIEPLLERIEQEVYSGESLRTLRAIAVLGRIGSAEARRLLDTLSHGAAEARITQQAQASVQRLDRLTSSP